MDKIEFTTISIPKTLYNKLEEHIKGTGFGTVSGFVNYLLRDLLASTNEQDLEFINKVRERLKKLGYLK